MKDTFYFPHDYNSRNDQRILNLRVKYGYEGYGLFWAILEYMAEHKDSCVYREAIGGLSLGLNYPIDKLQEFIDFCISENLFLDDGNIIFSKRMKEHKNMRKTLSDAGKLGAKKRWSSDKNSPPNSPPNAKERKGKERKYKKDSQEYKLYYLLISGIRRLDSKFKQPNEEKWCDEFDKIIRLDERTPQQIATLIMFVHGDGKNYQGNDFWRGNILSPKKLRDKWTQLMAQYKQYNSKK